MAKAPRPAVAAAPSDPRERIAEIASELEALRERAGIIHASPAPIDDALARIPDIVARLGDDLDVDLGDLGRASPADVAEGLRMAIGDRPERVLALIAQADPELLEGWIDARVRASYRDAPAAIGAAEREQRLAELEAQRRQLEQERADLLWDLHGRGQAAWTGDEDPAAVLGLDPLAA